MKRAILFTAVLLFVAIAPVYAQDSPLESPAPPPTLSPTDTPAPTATLSPTIAPDLPPGLDPDNPDIAEWLGLVAAAGGPLAAWLLERRRVAVWFSQFGPERKRWIALVLSATLAHAAFCLLGLLTSLPVGSMAVINALAGMVLNQVAHGRTLGK